MALASAAALALAPAARAETITYSVNETVPLAMSTENPCTGEPVTLSGGYHFNSRYAISFEASGITFHSVETKKLSLSGSSPVSGARYQNEQQEVSEVNGSFTFDLDGLAPYERTDKATMLLVRQGETATQDDFYVQFIAHTTYNANGMITVSGATLNVFCR